MQRNGDIICATTDKMRRCLRLFSRSDFDIRVRGSDDHDHALLSVNLAMPVDAPGSIPFRGDILVMRRAEHGQNVVNMRPGDARIADMLVPR